jgi:hypothetical protein
VREGKRGVRAGLTGKAAKAVSKSPARNYRADVRRGGTYPSLPAEIPAVTPAHTGSPRV